VTYFVLQYDVVDDFVNRRRPHREEHLGLVRKAQARGDVVMAGAIGDPPDGALLVFRVEAASVIDAFAREDPYVTHGLVTAWRVRPWHLVVGGDA
jgi:uncharacterized protein